MNKRLRPALYPWHEASLAHGAYWAAAIGTGLLAVGFVRLAGWAEELFQRSFNFSPALTLLTTPILFLASVSLVRRYAVNAGGSGIPQVLRSLELPSSQVSKSGLVSLRTALVKVASSLTGFLAGASTGMEGPSVQLASAIFWWVGSNVSKYGVKTDLRSFLVAGGAAGVAAAFNAPLAGVTFALEELCHGHFRNFQQHVILAIVLVGVTSHFLAGDHLYFGQSDPSPAGISLFAAAILVGYLAGLFGTLFSILIAHDQLPRIAAAWWKQVLLAGLVCAILGYFSSGMSAGSGHVATKILMTGPEGDPPTWLFAAKFVTTLCSYWSGMAGGLFCPSLSIGAGMGVACFKVLQLGTFQASAMLGMVGFFTGVIEAPLTAVVIVVEMTGEHSMILPFFVAAFCAQVVAKRLNPIPLYVQLSQRYAVKAARFKKP